MANIVSVFARIYPRDPHILALPVGPILNELINALGGKTYYVPVLVKQDFYTGLLDVQYGARWSGSSAYIAAEKFEEIETVWFRQYDSGADYDDIYTSGQNDPNTPNSRCQYRYDEVQVTWRNRIPEISLETPVMKLGQVWNVKVDGLYHASNDRCSLNHNRWEVFHSATESVVARPDDFSHLAASFINEFPLPIDVLLEHGQQVDFLYKSRRVKHVRIFPKEQYRGWFKLLIFHMDGWDNCADSYWNAYDRAFAERAEAASSEK